MVEYIADEDHFREVLSRVPNVRKTLWIGTADIKDLYVAEHPFLGILADLVSKGREVRLIHAKEPGPNFREDFDRYPILFKGIERGVFRLSQPHRSRHRNERCRYAQLRGRHPDG